MQGLSLTAKTFLTRWGSRTEGFLWFKDCLMNSTCLEARVALGWKIDICIVLTQPVINLCNCSRKSYAPAWVNAKSRKSDKMMIISPTSETRNIIKSTLRASWWNILLLRMFSSVHAQNKATQLYKVRATEIIMRNTATAFKIHEIGGKTDGQPMGQANP